MAKRGSRRRRGLVLVTGGAGFIGSHVVEALLESGRRVRVADNLSTGSLANLDRVLSRIEFLQADLTGGAACAEAVRGATEVCHLAAYQGVPQSIADPVRCNANGVCVTVNLLDAAARAGVGRFVLASSFSVYGASDRARNSEELPMRPMSPYAASKVAGEMYVRAFAETMGLDGASLRFSNVFGPRQRADNPYSGVITIFADRMRKGLRPTVFGDGLQTRDFVYVGDAARGFLAALDCARPLRGEAINIALGRSVTLLDLVEAMNRVLGTRLRPKFKPHRAGDIVRSGASVAKAGRLLGFRASTGLEKGLRLMGLGPPRETGARRGPKASAAHGGNRGRERPGRRGRPRAGPQTGSVTAERRDT